MHERLFTHDVELRRVRSCQLVKPTGWLSSSFDTSHRVAIRPRGGHVHQQLVNGMTNVTSESDLAVTHFNVGDTLGELARWVVAAPREEAGFSDELTVHVPLHGGSRWAHRVRRISTMTRLASSSTQTWSVARETRR